MCVEGLLKQKKYKDDWFFLGNLGSISWILQEGNFF